MQNALLTKFISKNKREKEFPEFRPGDTIKVHVKIKEGEKERLQVYFQEQAGEGIPRVSPRRHDQGSRQDQGRRERAPPGLRRRVDCPQWRGHGREHHRPQGQFRPGRGAYLPGTRQGGGPYRCRPHRPRTPRQAILSACFEGQGRPSERARLVSVSPCGGLRRVANSDVNRRLSENCARAASMVWRVSTKWAAARGSAPSSPAL